MRGYEVFETELTAIAEAGTRSSLFLSAGLAMVTLGLSLALPSESFSEVLPPLVVAVVGVLIMVFGWRERRTATSLIRDIRESVSQE